MRLQLISSLLTTALLAIGTSAFAGEQRYDGVITKVDVPRGSLVLKIPKGSRAFGFDNSTTVMAGTEHVGLESLKVGDHLAVFGTQKAGVGNWASKILITQEKPGTVVAVGKPHEFRGEIAAIDATKGTFRLANNSGWVMNAETKIHDQHGKTIDRGTLKVGDKVRVFVKDEQIMNIWLAN